MNLREVLRVFLLAVFTVPLIVFTSYSESDLSSQWHYDINKCFMDAGFKYNIHPNLLWAIAKVESNFNYTAINKNNNGTYDIGIMQINTSWLPVLKKHGLYDERQIWNPCYNIHVGAWILAQCIHQHGYSWEAVGCYNAVSKPKRARYSRKVWKVLEPYVSGN